MRKMHLAGLTAAVLGLATINVATAQQDNDTKNANRNNQNANRDASRRQTIRGWVAGVTVEDEMFIDTRTNRAVAAEMTLLTVVGSPARGNQDRSDASGNRNAGADRDNDRDRNDRNSDQANNAGANNRRRHNVYMLSVTPRTKVRLANSGDDANRNATNRSDANQNAANRNDANRNAANRNEANRNDNDDQGTEVVIAQLEVGDRVEITANLREDVNTGANAGNANAGARARHGRHRIYFGDAVEINILADQGGYRGDADSNRDNNRGRGRDRDGDNNRDRDNNQDRDAQKKDRDTDR